MESLTFNCPILVRQWLYFCLQWENCGHEVKLRGPLTIIEELDYEVIVMWIPKMKWKWKMETFDISFKMAQRGKKTGPFGNFPLCSDCCNDVKDTNPSNYAQNQCQWKYLQQTFFTLWSNDRIALHPKILINY